MADRTVTAKLNANVLGYVNNIKLAGKTTTDFAQNAVMYGQKHGAQLDALAMKAGILGAGLTALAGFAVKSAMDWETAWAGVTKTVSGTPQQLAAIEHGLRDMATQLPVTAEELAAIAESAGALGVETGSILSFTRVMADLGQTTNLTSDEAATAIAQLMNVMKTAPEDVDNLGSALVDLGNKGASTERDIIQMAQNIAGAGAIVGLSEANVLGLSNALASTGINAEAGGSAISNVMIDIAKAVDTNSDKLTDFAQVAGITAEDFAAKWKSDPAEALTLFIEGLGRMNDAGQNVFGTLDGLGQSDVRVTRALLNMAASGDMLRTSLAVGDKAWEKNTALAAEAGKRYDTTAAQTQMAWNEIKSAAIDAGEALLPVVASIAGGVGKIASAFGDLPGPVQGALTAITGVGGVGLLAAAGILKLVTSVAEAKTAFAALELSSPSLAANLGKVNKAAALTAAAFVAMQAGGALTSSSNTKAVEDFAKALLGAADGSSKARKQLDELSSAGASKLLGVFQATDSVEGLADAFDKVDTNKFESALGKITPYQDDWDKAADIIGQVDAALASFVGQGAPEEAAKVMAFLAEQTGKSASELEEFLPAYTTALSGADVQQKLTGDSATDMAAKVAEIPAAMQEARDAAQGTADSFFDISEGVDDADLSLDAWISKMSDQAKALEEFGDNAAAASKRGLQDGLIADLQELGPAGAMRMAQLADATDAEIARANKAWLRGQGAIEDYVDEVGGVPKDVSTTVAVKGIKEARAALLELRRFINGLPGVHIPIPSYGDEHREPKAAGGPIYGPGSGTSDDVPIMASNGEHMWTAAEVEAAGGHAAVTALRAAARSGQLSTREFAGSASYGGSSGPSALALDNLSGELQITNWETGEGRFRLIANSAANAAIANAERSEAGTRQTPGVRR